MHYGQLVRGVKKLHVTHGARVTVRFNDSLDAGQVGVDGKCAISRVRKGLYMVGAQSSARYGGDLIDFSGTFEGPVIGKVETRGPGGTYVSQSDITAGRDVIGVQVNQGHDALGDDHGEIHVGPDVKVFVGNVEFLR